MSHENAPATRLVATHCWACHRDLVDAKSVEVGMGPICRKKYGYDELSGLDNATRKAANALVYEAAAVHATAPDRVIAIADELATLGLVKLPEKMRDNFIPIKLTTVPNAPVYRYQGRAKGETQVGTADIVQVKTPKHGDWSRLLRSRLQYKRPVWDPKTRRFKHWEVKREEARALFGVLCACYPGRMAYSAEKGTFKVPTETEFKAKYAARR